MENKIRFLVFMCLATFLVQESSAIGLLEKKKVEEPCDTCPRQGKCVPKISCPAHIIPGSSSPECHLKNGDIGVCCYTGRRHSALNDLKNRTKSYLSKGDDLKKKILNASKAKWKDWCEKTLKLSDDTIVSPGSPDYGHRLSYTVADKEAKKQGEGAFLNFFAAQDLKKRQADDDELQLEYKDYEGPYCPPPPTCPDPPNPYRSIDGQCNNPDHPTWGASNTAYERLLKPAFDDGLWSIRTSRCNPGEPLPSARAISAAMLPDGDYPNDKCNLLFAHIGQFFAHDLTSAVIVTVGNGSSISCCSKSGGDLPPEQLHWACAPISVACDDKFYSTFNKTCMNFVRAQPAPSPDCSCRYVNPMNGVTHFFDLSQFYGNTEEKQNELRGPGGLMKLFDNYGRVLPPKTDRPECLISGEQSPCFDSGDRKGNQNTPLTCIHTLFTREHNRIATELARHNPGCDEDALFYSTKRIMVGMYQKIFKDWLVLLIGPKLMKLFDLEPCDGYSTAYDPEVNPSMMTEFAGAAFRLHSSVSGLLKVINPKDKNILEKIWLAEVMFEPKRMIRRDFYNEMLFGMSTQPMENIDPVITTELTNYMFRGSNNPFGLDIAALNIQRGRDFGIRCYNDYRQLCGLKPLKIEDFPKRSQERLASVYACADDIDLWIGGLLEQPCHDAVVGPVFGHIIAEQCSRSKKGDKYYYEYGSDINPTAFTKEELSELKKSSISRMVCDNSDGLIKSMPQNGFLRRDLPGNTPTPCHDPSIPSMDLSVFKIL